MTSADLYQVSFFWPHPEPTTVIVTGTFDEWSSKVHMTKTSTGFQARIKIPWNSKIKYKFVVDGEWLLLEDQPTEMDPGGFINNTYTAPPKPISRNISSPQSSDREKAQKAVANGHSEAAAGDALKHDPPIDSKSDTANSKPNATDILPGFPQLLSDLAHTIVASDGTTSALGYVASGLGAAMHSMVGVDPINAQKIAIPTPKLEEHFPLTNPTESSPSQPTESETSIPKSPPSPIAPIVPIRIIPVNAPESNTMSSSPPPEKVMVPPSSDAVPVLPDVNTEALTVKSTAPKAEEEAVVDPEVQKATHVKPEEQAVKEQTPASVENIESAAPPSKVDSTPTPEVVIPAIEKEPKTSAPPASSGTQEMKDTLVPEVPAKVAAVPADLTAGPKIVEDAPSPVVTTVEETPAVTQVKEEATPASFVPAIIPSNVEGKRETTEVSSSVEPTPPATHQVESESKPPTNGTVTLTSPSTPPKQEEPKLPSVPESQAFPSTSAPSVSQESSPSSSRFNSKRKKKNSILGKLKNIFHHEKDKEKK